MHLDLHVEYLLFLSDVNESRICSTDFRKKKTQVLNFIKVRPVGAEFLAGRRTDGYTYMTNLIVAFRNFLNAPKLNTK
jgi:hypothetical protein